MGVMPCPLIKTLTMHRPIKAVKARLPWKQNGQIKKVWLSLCMQVWMQKIRYHSLNFDKLTDIKLHVVYNVSLMVQYAVRRERKRGEKEGERERDKGRQRET